MNTRTLIVGTVALALVFSLGKGAWAKGRISHRQVRQHKRIAQGLRSGAITDREFIRLNREQYRIQNKKRRAWSDGYLNHKERHYLKKAQDRASRHVYRAKHNGITHRARHGGRYHYHSPAYHWYKKPGHRTRLAHIYHWYKPRYFYHWHKPPYYGNYFAGSLSQVGWNLAWSVDLD